MCHRRGHAEVSRGTDLPGGPVVKNLPCEAGDVDSISGQETEIPHAAEQLSPSTCVP